MNPYTARVAGLRERKKERQRWALVAAAFRLFEERGFAQTTIEAIAEAADVSPRTFFRYFDSKEDVILIDPAGKLELVNDVLATAHQDEPILDTLQRGWARLADEYLSDPGIAAGIYRLSRAEPVLAARLFSFQTQWSHAIAAAISGQLGVDPSTDIHPEIISSTAQTVVRSALNRWVEAGCPGRPHDVVYAAFATIGPALEVVLAQVRPSSDAAGQRRPTMPSRSASNARDDSEPPVRNAPG